MTVRKMAAQRTWRAPFENKNKHSRHALRPSFAKRLFPPENRGRREGRVSATPAAPVHEKKHGAGTTGEDGAIRPSLRNGLRLIARSPRGPGFVAPVIGEIISPT
jgi:hypothetical protein